MDSKCWHFGQVHSHCRQTVLEASRDVSTHPFSRGITGLFSFTPQAGFSWSSIARPFSDVLVLLLVVFGISRGGGMAKSSFVPFLLTSEASLRLRHQLLGSHEAIRGVRKPRVGNSGVRLKLTPFSLGGRGPRSRFPFDTGFSAPRIPSVKTGCIIARRRPGLWLRVRSTPFLTRSVPALSLAIKLPARPPLLPPKQLLLPPKQLLLLLLLMMMMTTTTTTMMIVVLAVQGDRVPFLSPTRRGTPLSV